MIFLVDKSWCLSIFKINSFFTKKSVTTKSSQVGIYEYVVTIHSPNRAILISIIVVVHVTFSICKPLLYGRLKRSVGRSRVMTVAGDFESYAVWKEFPRVVHRDNPLRNAHRLIHPPLLQGSCPYTSTREDLGH